MSDILDKLAQEVDKIESDAQTEPKAEKKTEQESGSPMESLLSEDKLRFPQVGDVIEGKVIEIGTNALYLSIEPFGTGMVMGREIKDGTSSGKIKIGDTVSATVTDLENEEGYIELSIREASYEKAWEDLESKRDTQEKIVTRVLSANKGGLLVELNGISGFLPVSQLAPAHYPRVEDGDKNKILALLKKLVGQELDVRILDCDRESEKLIVSEKAAQKEKDREVISGLQIGDAVEGEVSGVVDFGAFVKFELPGKGEMAEEDKLEGLVHISELAWQLIENPRDIVKVGQKVRAKIIGIDNDKISLSLRALEKDPWSIMGYKINDVVKGRVHKINHFGAFVYLDKDIHGLSHVSEMAEMFPGRPMEEMIQEGKEYDWKILSIDPKEHRMGLALVDKKSEKKAKKEENKQETESEKDEKPKKKNKSDEKAEKEPKKKTSKAAKSKKVK